MLPSLLTLAGLVQLTRATATNTTTTCPLPDATSCGYRSLWSILARCGVTLLICVWHAVHPALPPPHYKEIHVFLYRVLLMFLAFFAPEFLFASAVDERCEAKRTTKNFHDHGHKWWTVTHSYFAIMGGFALHDNTGIREINDNELLSLLDAKDILHPFVTKGDIMDKSDSDGLGKAIFIVQLFWFATQLNVRLFNHLSVTLVELDISCIALLVTFPMLLLFWWGKPHCPRHHHIFYTRDYNSDDSREISEGGDDSKALLPGILTIETKRKWRNLLGGTFGFRFSPFVFWFTRLLFGMLHALAWNYAFPTEIEKTLWHVSSLTLAGTPVLFFFITLLPDHNDLPAILVALVGVIARVYLVAAMLASLRSLPCSAYETIPWTNYIPHL